MRGQGRKREARRAFRWKISDLNLCKGERKDRKIRWRCLRLQCGFQRIQKVLQESLSESWVAIGILHLPGTCMLLYSYHTHSLAASHWAMG